MNCGMKLIKYLLFAFNLLFFILAIALIGVGAGVDIKYKSLVPVTGSAISSAPVLLICIGVFIFIVSFFGCCGAWKENYCMVSTFAVLMGIIFILEISAAITAYVLRGKAEEILVKSFTDSINEYKTETAKPFDVIQEKFKCCGSMNYTDWWESESFQKIANETAIKLNVTESDRATNFVPDSCCAKVEKECGLKKDTAMKTQGCVTTIEKFLKDNIVTVGGIALAVVFIQIVGLIFACILMRTIKAQYETV